LISGFRIPLHGSGMTAFALAPAYSPSFVAKQIVG
jgi:hypothetical protein